MDLVVGVFFFALIFVPIGLIVWACIRAYRGRNVWVDGSANLGLPVDHASTHAISVLTPRLQRLRYRLTSHSPHSVVFEKKYKPIWLLIPIIAFFPVGLLALIYSKTISMAFSFQAQSGTATQVDFTGQGPPELHDELLQALSGAPVQALD